MLCCLHGWLAGYTVFVKCRLCKRLRFLFFSREGFRGTHWCCDQCEVQSCVLKLFTATVHEDSSVDDKGLRWQPYVCQTSSCWVLHVMFAGPTETNKKGGRNHTAYRSKSKGNRNVCSTKSCFRLESNSQELCNRSAWQATIKKNVQHND